MIDNHKEKNLCWALGVLFIITGIICNEWALKYLFSSDGSIGTSKRILIWSLDVTLIAIGAIFIFRRNSLKVRKLIYGVITISIAFFLLELGLHVAAYFMNLKSDEKSIDKTYLLSPYEGKEWAKELFTEYDELTGGAKQFRGWGKNEYHGKYVNIDSRGVRRTWNPADFGGEEPKTLFVFGPSAAWGYGSRDEYTLPSYISRQLNEKGYSFEVHNYGEYSYSFTQQLMYLITLLRDGHRPDYVLIYAWTDIYNAYQSGTPGTLHFDFLRTTENKQFTNIQHIWFGIGNIIRENFLIYKEIRKILNRLDPPESKFTEVAHTYDDIRIKKLLADTIEHFSKSYQMLDTLSKAYGFKYMTFSPPILFLEEKMTDEEAATEVRLHDKTLMKLYSYADDIYKTNSFPKLYNISDALKERSKTYYLDFGHLSEEGNEIVAKKIVSLFEKEYLLNEQ